MRHWDTATTQSPDVTKKLSGATKKQRSPRVLQGFDLNFRQKSPGPELNSQFSAAHFIMLRPHDREDWHKLYIT
ncbi:MAG: hypothetical protein H0V72_21180 [Bradyrhizobium sp.]|nr:hypothetical protein [Bradyrhizobium sp.]